MTPPVASLAEVAEVAEVAAVSLAARRAGSWSVSCAGDRLPAILIPL